MRIGVVLAGGASSQSLTNEQVVPTGLLALVAGRGINDGGTVADEVVAIVAADSGLDLARRLEIVPTLVVGDLDSVTDVALAWARGLGVEIREVSADKDETDLDLALDAAIEAGIDRLVVLGGDGGRLDHLLGNIGAIVRAGRRVPTEAWIGDAMVAVVIDRWTATLPAGATVSVVPCDAAVVVSESGVRWTLDRHVLPVGSTQGISNEAAPGGPVEITVHEGVALVIVPNAKDLT